MRFLLLTLMISVSLISCHHSSDVVSKRVIQKRKYRSGFLFQKRMMGINHQKRATYTHNSKSRVSAKPESKTSIPKSKTNWSDTTKPSHQKEIKMAKPLRRWFPQPPICNRLKYKRIKPPSDGIEEDISDADKEKNNKKLIACGIVVVGAILYSIAMVILVYLVDILLFIEILSSIFFIGLAFWPFIILAGLVAGLLGVFYLIEFAANEKGKTIFTPKFKKTIGITTLLLSILAALIFLGSGAILGLFIGVILTSIDIVGVFFLVLFTFLIALIFFVVYLLSLWPVITGFILSVKDTNSAKIAGLIQIVGWLAGIAAFIVIALMQS